MMFLTYVLNFRHILCAIIARNPELPTPFGTKSVTSILKICILPVKLVNYVEITNQKLWKTFVWNDVFRQRFQEFYLDEFSKKFDHVSKSVKGDHLAYCTCSRSDLSIYNSGEYNITSHQKSAKQDKFVNTFNSVEDILTSYL